MTLDEIVAEKGDGAKFYSVVEDTPELHEKIVDLFRCDILSYLVNRPVWRDRKDYNPAKATDEDIKHLEVINYLDGRLDISDFKYAKDSIKITTPEFKASYVKLRLKLKCDDKASKSAMEQKLNEVLSAIIKEKSEQSKKENKLYVVELIPEDVETSGYLLALIDGKENLAQVLDFTSKYSLREANVLKWHKYVTIDLQDGELYNLWMPVENFLQKDNKSMR